MRPARFPLPSARTLLHCAALWAPALAAAAPAALTLSEAQVRQAGIATAPAAAASAPATLTLSGTATLPPQAAVLVSAPVAGVVQAVLVEPADAVRAGQPLLRLHSPELVATQREYLQLRLQHAQAADRLQRDERLFADGVIAESRLRESRYAEQQARVAADERRQALRLAGVDERRAQGLVERMDLQPGLTLAAPAAGRVAELLAQPGQQVPAGTPLLRLARPAALSLTLQATPAQAAQLRPGATLALLDCAVTGRVRGTVPAMQGAAQAVLVQATLDRPADCVQPNQAVRARVSAGTAAAGAATSAVRVPAAALVQLDGREQVFVATGGGYQARPVRVLARDGDQALVDGLPAGTAVVVRGTAALKGAWAGLGEAQPAAPAASAAGTAASAGGR